MADAELIKVLQQIRDELREMNGKDSDGNRVSGKSYTIHLPKDPTTGKFVVTPPYNS